jgi:uncharacterized integral membrane protein
MKKATVIIWAVITVLIGIVFYDNWDIISNKISLSIRFVVKPIPPLPIFVYFIIFFFFGFIIAYLFNFSVRFKARRTTKKLNAAITSQEGEVAELKREVSTLKGLETSAAGQGAKTKTDSDAIIELTGDSLVEKPANPPGKSSTDKQEANPAKESKDKSSQKKS